MHAEHSQLDFVASLSLSFGTYILPVIILPGDAELDVFILQRCSYLLLKVGKLQRSEVGWKADPLDALIAIGLDDEGYARGQRQRQSSHEEEGEKCQDELCWGSFPCPILAAQSRPIVERWKAEQWRQKAQRGRDLVQSDAKKERGVQAMLDYMVQMEE